MNWEMKMTSLRRTNHCRGENTIYDLHNTIIFILATQDSELSIMDFHLFGCHAIEKDGYYRKDQIRNPHSYNRRKISIRGKCF